MDPLLGAGLITGGANLLGSIFGSDQSAKNTQAQIMASQQQQATQNAFSERMSSTAYQRASTDMKAAGLNPMMMFGSGSAASSPTGSSIQAPMPQNKSPFEGLGTAAAQAMQAAVSAKTMDKMAEEMSLMIARRKLTEQEKLTEEQETVRRGNEASHSGLRLPEARLKATEAEGAERIIPRSVREVGGAVKYGAERIGDIAAPFLSSARGIKYLMPDKVHQTETTRSGSRWKDELTGENHYEDTTFSKRWPH
ncbi:DNA pilot protein [Blackfly microvirus SF02]|uniref:DNA pilot protein n=1 Tax=Blackfly microvirus SF02 TaxID=2576452 RepID=A0A4P8PTG8_9VIRU|nr:DNA pilot protein [Blackfly microvirus SF02]